MNKEVNKNQIKALALYLPQFHPIIENDQWWGKGFTEWTNVTKARPLFPEHWQPRLPRDLGFYDLRVPETRQAQADLAREYGIYGFCYWHYWFAGKRIIEQPFSEVVSSGNPDFPFCLSWANQTWSGTWHGLSNDKILIEQTYPGDQDFENHFYALLNAFRDERYIEIEGKKLFFVFRPMDLPEPKRFVDCWQNLALKEGLKGMHLIAMHMPYDWNPSEYGFDAFTQHWDSFRPSSKLVKAAKKRTVNSVLKSLVFRSENTVQKGPEIFSYSAYAHRYPHFSFGNKEYPMICVDWDNTPRSGEDGWLFNDFSLEDFKSVCLSGFRATGNKPPGEKFVLVKSWNEWAEGNYMEPDQKFGKGYLEAFKESLDSFKREATLSTTKL